MRSQRLPTNLPPHGMARIPRLLHDLGVQSIQAMDGSESRDLSESERRAASPCQAGCLVLSCFCSGITLAKTQEDREQPAHLQTIMLHCDECGPRYEPLSLAPFIQRVWGEINMDPIRTLHLLAGARLLDGPLSADVDAAEVKRRAPSARLLEAEKV